MLGRTDLIRDSVRLMTEDPEPAANAGLKSRWEPISKKTEITGHSESVDRHRCRCNRECFKDVRAATVGTGRLWTSDPYAIPQLSLQRHLS